MWLNQASGLAPDSAANSLPTRSGTPEIPLLAEPPRSTQATDINAFFPAVREIGEVRALGIGIAPGPLMA
jgi:hypothetical protein